MCPKCLRPRLAVLALSDSSSAVVQECSLILSRPVRSRERAEERLRESCGACYPLSGLFLHVSLLPTPQPSTHSHTQFQTHKRRRLWSNWHDVFLKRESCARELKRKILTVTFTIYVRGSRRRIVTMARPPTLHILPLLASFEGVTWYSWGIAPCTK